ncbi:hypothetical protein N9H78_00825 [Winogradskyella sp.]|nr:hypothetical protein [Winogradskyella sp.]MDA8874198.1 hypothetical protein [Winogradskyella sp.]
MKRKIILYLILTSILKVHSQSIEPSNNNAHTINNKIIEVFKNGGGIVELSRGVFELKTSINLLQN